MKVHNKTMRKIIVEGLSFLWIVEENKDNVKARVYSSVVKSAYFEVVFDWQTYHDININRPYLVRNLIEYALNHNWKYDEKASVLRFYYRAEMMSSVLGENDR